MNAEERLLHHIFEGPTLAELVDQQQQDELLKVFVARRTASHLRIVPALAAMMLESIMPSTQARDGGRGSKGATAPMPLRITALADVNDLFALLVNWVTHFARQLSVYPAGSAALYMDADRECVGFPRLNSRAIAVGMVQEVSDWLTLWQEPIGALEVAGEWQRDLDENMRTWLARYPMEIVEPTLPRTCPTCGKWAVRVHWSEAVGHYDDYRLRCDVCGEVVAVQLAVDSLHPDDCAGCIEATNHQNGDQS